MHLNIFSNELVQLLENHLRFLRVIDLRNTSRGLWVLLMGLIENAFSADQRDTWLSHPQRQTQQKSADNTI